MIYGKQTRLRRIERQDIPTFVRWFSDPEVRKYLMINRPISTAEEEKRHSPSAQALSHPE